MLNGSKSWLTRLLRLSLFPTQVSTEQASWYKTVTGTEPETQLTQRATSQFEGPFQTGKLSLLVQPGRIDWLLSSPDSKPEDEELPTIGSFESSLKTFLALFERWYSLAPTAERLALGADLLQPAPSLKEVYELLAEYLSKKVQLDPEESSDFIYRINRPIQSHAINGLRINRLCTWSAIQTSVVSFQLPPGRPTLSHAAITPTGRPAARVEMDINTAADYTGQFAGQAIKSAFDELASLATEIAVQGEQ